MKHTNLHRFTASILLFGFSIQSCSYNTELSMMKNGNESPIATNTTMRAQRDFDMTVEQVIAQKNPQHALSSAIRYMNRMRIDPEKPTDAQANLESIHKIMQPLHDLYKNIEDSYQAWVRYLSVANKIRSCYHGDNVKNFIRGNTKMVDTLLLSSGEQDINDLDWRITRKILASTKTFEPSFIERIDRENLLLKFQEQIDKSLQQMIWHEEDDVNNFTREMLHNLRNHCQTVSKREKRNLINSIICGRFQKSGDDEEEEEIIEEEDDESSSIKPLPFLKGDKNYTLILGEDGGLFVLLNSLEKIMKQSLLDSKLIASDYLADKTDKQTHKTILGKGGFGKVRLALTLLQARSYPGDLICVKKTYSFKKLGIGRPIDMVTDSTLEDYFTGDIASITYSPIVLDMALVIDKESIKSADHKKGYLFMEVLPQNTATKIFAQKEFQKWEYQKPYLLDILNGVQELLKQNTAMTDLKPDNTLYDVDKHHATIIDLGGTVKADNLENFDLRKSFQYTKEFTAPEVLSLSGTVDMAKALSYSCGKVFESIIKSGTDLNKNLYEKILEKLLYENPATRISIPNAIEGIQNIGDDSWKEKSIFTTYILKIKEALRNDKSSISINEDIEDTQKCFIPLQVTTLDPDKYKDLDTHDIFETLDQKFFNADTQVFLLLANAGYGKSIVMQQKFIEAVNEWEIDHPLPVYFNLADNIDLDKIMISLDQKLHTNIKNNIVGRNLCLYVDSFDEGLGIADKQETLIKNYISKLSGETDKNVKILINCRSSYLRTDDEDRWFIPESKSWKKYYITSLNYKENINVSTYTNNWCQTKKSEYTPAYYTEMIEKHRLQSVINTGSLFQMTMEVLSNKNLKLPEKLDKSYMYQFYADGYIEKRISKLNPVQKETITSSFKNKLSLRENLQALAQYMANLLHVKGDSRLDQDTEIFEFFKYKTSTILEYQTIYHILKTLPLKIEKKHTGDKYGINKEIAVGFIHDTLKNHFLLEAIKGELQTSGRSSLLASRSIVEDAELIMFIRDAIEYNRDPELTQQLRTLIDHTKKDKSMPAVTAAANAITCLVASRYSFTQSKDLDLRDISILGANLENGIFCMVDFSRADLTNVNLTNAKLTKAKFIDTNMKGLELSIYPSLQLKHDNDIWGKKSVIAVGFATNDKYVVSGGSDNTARIWDTESGKQVKVLQHTSPVVNIAFSRDCKYILSASSDIIKIWDFKTGEQLKLLKGHIGSVESVNFSSDNKYIVSGSNDFTIRLWCFETGKQLKLFDGHTNTVTSVIFFLDNKYLISGSGDESVKVWNCETGEQLLSLKGHTNQVNSVAVSNNSAYIISGSGFDDTSSSCDNTIRVWDWRNERQLKVLRGHEYGVYCLAFSHDDKYIVSGSRDTTVRVWDMQTYDQLQLLEGHTAWVHSVAFSSDSRYIFSGSYDNTVRTWDRKNEKLQLLGGHTDGVWSVNFSSNNDYLVSGSSDCTSRIWNCETGEQLQIFQKHTNYVISATTLPMNDKYIVSCSWDGTTRIWHRENGKELHKLDSDTGKVTSVAISSDGKYVASGSKESVTIWDRKSGEQLILLDHSFGRKDMVLSVSFSPNNDYLVSGSRYGATIWSADDWSNDSYLYTGDPREGWKRTSFESVAFSPSNEYVVSGSNDNAIRIWSMETPPPNHFALLMPSSNEIIQLLKGHTGQVNSVAFSPDEKYVASGSADFTVRLWNWKIGTQLQLFRHRDGVNSIAFSPNCKYLASGSFDKTIRLWDLKYNVLVREISAQESGLDLQDVDISRALNLSKSYYEIFREKGFIKELYSEDHADIKEGESKNKKNLISYKSKNKDGKVKPRINVVYKPLEKKEKINPLSEYETRKANKNFITKKLPTKPTLNKKKS